MPGLVLQAMHTDDAAEAYARAVTSDVRGAFNLAAEPVVDRDALAEVLGGRPIPVPARPARALIAAAWHARLSPAAPDLFDFVLEMPLLDASRARSELAWNPRRTSIEALEEFRAGLRDPAGFATPPLAPSRRGR